MNETLCKLGLLLFIGAVNVLTAAAVAALFFSPWWVPALLGF
jgi:hypothetical protein